MINKNNNTMTKQVIKLTESEALHYGRKEAKYLVRFNEIGGWTKDALVVKGRYSDNPKTGFIMGNGNLGTNSALYTTLKK